VPSAPRIHSRANPNISPQAGALSRQLYAPASAAVSKASHATPSKASRVGCSRFQAVGLSQPCGPALGVTSLIFQRSHSRWPPSRLDSESRIYLLMSFR
jgi:hypothetical protein